MTSLRSRVIAGSLMLFYGLAAFLAFAVFAPKERVLAADNNFADGITVDSTGDGADANIADSICDDGAGHTTGCY